MFTVHRNFYLNETHDHYDSITGDDEGDPIGGGKNRLLVTGDPNLGTFMESTTEEREIGQLDQLIRQGIWRTYSMPGGEYIRRTQYKDGKIHGFDTFYSTSGRITIIRRYSHDTLVREYTNYTRDEFFFEIPIIKNAKVNYEAKYDANNEDFFISREIGLDADYPKYYVAGQLRNDLIRGGFA